MVMKTAEEWAAEFFVDRRLQESLCIPIRQVQADAIHWAAKSVKAAGDPQTARVIRELSPDPLINPEPVLNAT